MSSMRNAVARRPHRERAQPLERAKHGLLEKHKDYSKRAADFNAKKARLRLLRQKATDRNPDEFYFSMMSSRTKNGIKVADRGNKALNLDVVKLMKTQDAGYLKTMATRTRKEIERLEQEMQLVEKKVGEGKTVVQLKALKPAAKGVAAKHTVYVDDVQLQRDFEPETWLGTDIDGLSRAYNRPRRDVGDEEDQDEVVGSTSGRKKSQREQDADLEARKAQRAVQKKREHQQEKQKALLEALRDREDNLLTAERELESQRDRMQNNVGGVNKNGVKFKVRERKR